MTIFSQDAISHTLEVRADALLRIQQENNDALAVKLWAKAIFAEALKRAYMEATAARGPKPHRDTPR